MQVRDWFKDRRLEEEAPVIVEETKSDIFLSNGNVKVKMEPVEEEETTDQPTLEEIVDPVKVKQEPADEEEEEGPVSSVLRSKASILSSLTKKIELASKPKDLEGTNEIQNVLDVLDDDIMITSESIVNPGKKRKEPLGQVLNQFLSQIEQLEKTMDISEIAKNGDIDKIVREGGRKDKDISDLKEALNRRNADIEAIKVELGQKNDEIESVLLNCVSKETFIRTQFQKLGNEIKELKADKEKSKELVEEMAEMKTISRRKDEEVEDMKAEVKATHCLVEKSKIEMKDLQDKSTKIIGDITKGIGAKLADAKIKEAELEEAKYREKVLENDLKDMVTKVDEQTEEENKTKEENQKVNDALSSSNNELNSKIEELKATNKDLLEEGTQFKDDNVKLRERQEKLKIKFRTKVQDINDSLKNYHENLGKKSKELLAINEVKQAMEENIVSLEETVENQDSEIKKLREREEELLTTLELERMEKKAKEEQKANASKINVENVVEGAKIDKESKSRVISNPTGFFMVESNDDDKAVEEAKEENKLEKFNTVDSNAVKTLVENETKLVLEKPFTYADEKKSTNECDAKPDSDKFKTTVDNETEMDQDKPLADKEEKESINNSDEKHNTKIGKTAETLVEDMEPNEAFTYDYTKFKESKKRPLEDQSSEANEEKKICLMASVGPKMFESEPDERVQLTQTLLPFFPNLFPFFSYSWPLDPCSPNLDENRRHVVEHLEEEKEDIEEDEVLTSPFKKQYDS